MSGMRLPAAKIFEKKPLGKRQTCYHKCVENGLTGKVTYRAENYGAAARRLSDGLTASTTWRYAPAGGQKVLKKPVGKTSKVPSKVIHYERYAPAGGQKVLKKNCWENVKNANKSAGEMWIHREREERYGAAARRLRQVAILIRVLNSRKRNTMKAAERYRGLEYSLRELDASSRRDWGHKKKGWRRESTELRRYVRRRCCLVSNTKRNVRWGEIGEKWSPDLPGDWPGPRWQDSIQEGGTCLPAAKNSEKTALNKSENAIKLAARAGFIQTVQNSVLENPCLDGKLRYIDTATW
ncbi:hypothetical protein B0H11DRAFT_1905361 [Mycena galericulata]|nr:hypothetical protein B0H11DRAFT_1905361 [Mycena galericulata]